MEDSKRSITRSAMRFLSGTLLSRITGLLRDVAMAGAFGTQQSVAGFLVAFRFAHLFRRLLGEGALQTAFIPQFEKVRSEGSDKAFAFFKDLNSSLSAVLAVLVIASLIVLSGLWAFGGFSEANREILWLTALMMPSLFFICLFGLNASLLQAEKRFFLTGVAPVAFNAVWIISVLLLWTMPATAAMPWLSLGIIFASAAQWLITVPATLALLRKNGVIGFFSHSPGAIRTMIPLLQALSLSVIGISAAQINNALDAIFARYADLEGPAYLWYAIRIQQFPLALFSVALSGALLPPLARALKNGDKENYSRFMEYSLAKTIGMLLPFTAGIFLLGDAAIRLIYGRGWFEEHSILGTTQCLWGYGFGLVPMGLVLILGPAFYAKEDYKTPAKASVGAMAMNIALNGLFVLFLGYGPASVAWATSLSAWGNAAYLAIKLQQEGAPIFTSTLCKSGVKVAGATLAGCAGLWAWGTLIGSEYASFVGQLASLAGHFSAFSIAFFGGAFVVKAHDVPFYKGT